MVGPVSHHKGKGLTLRNNGFVFFALAFITSFFLFLPSVSAFSVTDLNTAFSSPISLTAFILLGVFCLFFLLVGFGVPLPYFSVLGFFLLFVIGGFLQAGSLLLPTGEITNVYGDNYDDYHYDDYNETAGPQVMDLNLFHYYKETEPFDNPVSHLVGLFIMFVGAMGMVFGAFASFGEGGF